jgi:PDZ domain-containing protein
MRLRSKGPASRYQILPILPMQQTRNALQFSFSLLLLLAFSACSAHMAMTQPEKKNLRVLETGTPRTDVIAELGLPQTTVDQGGTKLDQFQFKEGYAKEIKVFRALFHVLADAFTFGIWEPFGILFEKSVTGKDIILQVHYDAHDRLSAFEIVSGETTVLAKSREQISPLVAEPSFSWSVTPVLMPQTITSYPQRLAVIQPQGPTASFVSSGLDLTLAYLRTFHPTMAIVERDGLEPVTQELVLQHTGKMRDDTMARLGGWKGADTLLILRIERTSTDQLQTLTQRGGEVAHSVEIRLAQVETGLLLFRQATNARVQVPQPAPDRAWPDEVSDNAQRETLRVAYTYAMASLAAAFGDNPLGLVPDMSSRSEGIHLLGLLHGGPGHIAGLQKGDRILEVDGKPYRSVTQRIPLPTMLLVEQGNERKNVHVEALRFGKQQ